MKFFVWLPAYKRALAITSSKRTLPYLEAKRPLAQTLGALWLAEIIEARRKLLGSFCFLIAARPKFYARVSEEAQKRRIRRPFAAFFGAGMRPELSFEWFQQFGFLGRKYTFMVFLFTPVCDCRMGGLIKNQTALVRQTFMMFIWVWSSLEFFLFLKLAKASVLGLN